MTHYLQIKDNKIISHSTLPVSDVDVQNIEVNDYIYTSYVEMPERFYYEDNEIKTIPQEQIERERINLLTMTAWDFVEVLKSCGLTSAQIKEFLNSNPDIDLHLTCCKDVYCGVAKALMPITFDGITITADMVEQAFKNKYGL